MPKSSKPLVIPVAPNKPYNPTKPNENNYQLGDTIKGRSELARISDSSDVSISIGDLLAKVDPEVKQALTIDALCLAITTDVEYGYYDSTTVKLEVALYTEQEVPNPNQAAEQKRYDLDLKRYEQALGVYKEAMKEYRERKKAYDAALKEWQIDQAKQTLKRLGANE